MQRLYAAAVQEIAEVREETPRCTPAEAAKGWLMAARFAMWRVWAADEAVSKGIARRAGSCAFVDGLRSRLLQQAAGWKGDVCYQEVAVRGGSGISVGRTPVTQAWDKKLVGGGVDAEYASAGGRGVEILVAAGQFRTARGGGTAAREGAKRQGSGGCSGAAGEVPEEWRMQRRGGSSSGAQAPRPGRRAV